MTKYLGYNFEDTEAFVNTFDELPLWSAPFGLLLLSHLELRANLKIIDIGSGTGFPLMELASRCGSSCRLYGIDPWQNANKRALQKIINYDIPNVEIIEGSAENIPLEDNEADLVVSSLGINNFRNPDLVFRECYRILKPGGKLVLTTNLRGHWKEFYDTFRKTLTLLGKANLIHALTTDEEHRGTAKSISAQFTESGFQVTRCITDKFEMKFLDGTAFFNHHFIKPGWLESWKSFFPKDALEEISVRWKMN